MLIYPVENLKDSKKKLEKLINENKAELETLLAQQDKTYMNFVRPYMEASSRITDFFSPISHLQGVKNSPESQEAFTSCIGILSEYSTELSHNRAVYDAFAEIKEREYESLPVAARKVLDDAIFEFELEGVSLPEEQKQRVKEINITLSELADNFSQNVLNATNAYKILLTDESLLGEMPESDRMTAKTEKGWEFTLQMPSYIAFMTYVTDRAKREEVYRAYSTRAPENGELIEAILALKHEKAKILGYDTYARLKNRTMAAPSVDAVLEFLNKLADSGKPFAEKEWSQLGEYAAADGLSAVEAWDTAYYTDKIKKKEYSYDEEALRPYFEKERVVAGMFEVLGRLFDLKFEKAPATLWNEEAVYYKVSRLGEEVGGFFMDLEAREDKRGGAWMDNWHSYHKDPAQKLHLPDVYIVANFPKSTPGMPSLLRHDDVTTLFHEMGHALHHLMSRVDEEAVSGVNGIDWDTVEFPSQFFENFAYAPEVLDMIGIHYKTGEKLPSELVNKIVSVRNFQAGMALVRQLEFGLFDMLIHEEPPLSADSVQQVLDDVRKRVAVIKAPAYNKFQHGFSHIFSGGYAAGYYSYKWAEMLSSDAYCAFEEKGVLNKELADSYRKTVLADGASRSMGDIYRDFLGRDPDPEAILRLAGMVS